MDTRIYIDILFADQRSHDSEVLDKAWLDKECAVIRSCPVSVVLHSHRFFRIGWNLYFIIIRKQLEKEQPGTKRPTCILYAKEKFYDQMGAFKASDISLIRDRIDDSFDSPSDFDQKVFEMKAGMGI
jgi:hypothetical protein